jgi:hypothetical protein
MAAKHTTTRAPSPTAAVRPTARQWEEVPASRGGGDTIDLAPGEEVTVTIVERSEASTQHGPKGIYSCTLDDGLDTPVAIWESADLRRLAPLVGETVKLIRIEDTDVGSGNAKKTYKIYRQR